MTPEQRALDLVEKFYNTTTTGRYYAWSTAKEKNAPSYQRAKACALICVEEILALGVGWYSKALACANIKECDTLEYWEAVKTELQNL